MPLSTITVQHSDGSPARGVRVSLGFSFGMTDAHLTDKYGVAVVEHSSVGRATVFAAGRDQGSFHAPGRYVVTL